MSSSKIQSANDHSTRFFGLDIIRAIAIILVVIGHGNFILKNTRFNHFPYINLIDGVDIFFVLSGFLIGKILLKEIDSDPRFGLKKLKRFWERRWLRTLPNYYLILLANYLVVHYQIINEDINQFSWKFIFFLQNFSSPFYGFFWESWSLSVEEWFYVSTPILLVLSLKVFNPKKSFLIVTILMLVLPLWYRSSIVNPNIDDNWYDLSFRKLVITRLDSIAYGLLGAWIFNYFNQYWEKFKTLSFIIGISLIVLITNYESANITFYKQVVYFAITPFSVMLLLPYAQSVKTQRGLLSKSITHISKISYSMYLINLALVAEVIRDNFPPKSEWDAIAKYVIYWSIVIIASSLIYKYFEKPILNWRDRR